MIRKLCITLFAFIYTYSNTADNALVVLAKEMNRLDRLIQEAKVAVMHNNYVQTDPNKITKLIGKVAGINADPKIVLEDWLTRLLLHEEGDAAV